MIRMPDLAGPAVLLALAALAALAACSPPPPISPQDRADQQAQAACRQRADEIFAQQNRGTIFASSDDRLTPFSGSYNPGITTRGLGERFGRDTAIAECVRNAREGAAQNSSTGPAMQPTAQPASGPL